MEFVQVFFLFIFNASESIFVWINCVTFSATVER